MARFGSLQREPRLPSPRITIPSMSGPSAFMSTTSLSGRTGSSGSTARLVNGELITGTNQENASYPVGICAERTLLSVAGALFPGVAIDTLAVSYDNEQGSSDRPISPCGICRQSLQEFEQRTG